jgi:hypothetical protein
MSAEWELVPAGGWQEPEEDAAALGGAAPGDQVAAPRLGGLYYHHGVLCDDRQTVLHVNAGPFSGAAVCLGLRPAMVRADPLPRFLKRAPSLTLVARAGAGAACRRQELVDRAGGPAHYSLLFRNCEHYASETAGLPSRSPQVQRALLLGGLGAVALMLPPGTALCGAAYTAAAAAAVQAHAWWCSPEEPAGAGTGGERD